MNTRIQIVDNNDEIIGHKDRDKVDYAKDIYRSACLWLENGRGDVLLAQRKLSKDKDPGKWGPAVSGTVDEGETYATNIIKEAEEEIGLSGVNFTPVAKLREVAPRQYFIQIFRSEVDKPVNEFTPQESEVEQLHWIPKQELIKDLSEHPEKYVPSMPKLISILG